MKTNTSRIFTYLRFGAGCAFFAVSAALAFVATSTNVLTTPNVGATKGLALAKSSVQDRVSGSGSEKSDKDGSFQSPATRAEEEAAKRAFPFTETPFSAQLNSVVSWRRFQAASASNVATTTIGGRDSAKNKKGKPEPPRFNTWSLIGPSTALFPNILTFTGSAATTSGRITALALDTHNACNAAFCRVWLGAAGGGVWRTTNALSATPSWTFLTSLNVMSNAIGALTYFNDGSANGILYVGTGEGNASADSEAGLGIMKSTDGGNSWTILNAQIGPITTFSNGSGTNGTYTGNAFFGRAVNSIAVLSPSVFYVGSVRSVRGVDETYGAPTSNPPVPRPPFGLFKTTDGGNTFTFVWDGGNNCPASCVGGDPQASIRGVTEVEIDPNNPNIVYAAAFPGAATPSGGIYRSLDGGSTWAQIKTPNTNAVNTARCSFDVTTGPPLAAGVTRMYAGCGDQGVAAAHVFRSDNVNTAATFTDLTALEVQPFTLNYCTGQCWYDNLIYTPPGFPDIVYVGGSYTYNECGEGSDCRGLVFATDAGASGGLWSDATWDAQNNGTPAGTCCQPNAVAPNGIHPDQHAIFTVPGSPFQFIEGSDGGIVRSNGTLSDISAQCLARTFPAGTGNFTQCIFLLGAPPCATPCGVPTTIFTGMNAGLSTLQFNSISYNSSNPFNVQGGTQDNGTFQTFGSTTWNQEIYGDGGQSGFSRTNGNLRVNTFTGQANDANFQNGDPAKWVVIGANMENSPEGALFYPPVIADPHPGAGQTIFEGSFGVWRTQDWGGNQAFLELNCPEFFTSAAQPGCGDFVRLGGPAGTNTAGSLIGTFYGASRTGGDVNFIERTTSNTSTAWAGTTGGRLFISTNIDGPAASVVWNRLEPSVAGNDPTRVPTGAAIDPVNTNHAWVTYSGYSSFTPSQPGHVFSVSWSGAGVATFTNISFNLPDIPLTSIAFDPLTGDLYTSSDFAVFRMKFGTQQWDIAGIGMPIVEVPKITINPNARVLYAATHGLSVWSLPLY